MATYRKLGDKTNTVYMDGKAPKDDKYYNTTQLSCLIYEMANIKGCDETIKYLQDKVKQLKKMQGGDK